MSMRTAIAWLVAAAVLGILGVAIVRTGARPRAWGVLGGFSPSEVIGLEVTSPAGGGARVVLDGATRTWWLVSDTTIGSWPVQTEAVRAGLRVLAETLADTRSDPEAEIGSNPAVIGLDFSDGTRLDISLSGRALGGRVIIGVDHGDGARAGVASADLYTSFVEFGPRSWRSTTPLADVAQSASRIVIETAGSVIRLQRISGQWIMTEPVAAPCDQPGVARLLAAVGAIRVARFLDREKTSEPSLGAAPVAITVETDIRSAEGAVVATRRRVVEFGGSADLGGESVLARVMADEGDRRCSGIVAVSAGGLEEIPADARELLSARAVRISAADIGGLLVSAGGVEASEGQTGGATFERIPDGWRWSGPGDLLSESDAAALNSALALLCETDGVEILISAPADWETAAHVLIRDHRGRPIEAVEIGALRDDGSALVRTADVYRRFDRGGAALRWIIAHTGG